MQIKFIYFILYIILYILYYLSILERNAEVKKISNCFQLIMPDGIHFPHNYSSLTPFYSIKQRVNYIYRQTRAFLK